MNVKSVGVIGAGAWGTGFAQALGRGGHKVTLWALEPEVVDSINNEHENKKFLPGFKLSENLTCSSNLENVASDKDFLIFASPSLYLASTVKKLITIPSIADGETYIGVLTKGFVPSKRGPKLCLETIENVLPGIYKGNTVYISGPSHAEEVAMGNLQVLLPLQKIQKIRLYSGNL